MQTRKERRAARVKLTPTRIYTFRATGDVLTLMGEGILVRRDAQLVSISWSLGGPQSNEVTPVFTAHPRLGGGWRVRMARWLLHLA